MLFDENTPYDFKITCPLFADDLQSNNLEEAYVHAIESRFALRRKLIQIDETIRSLITESTEIPYPVIGK